MKDVNLRLWAIAVAAGFAIGSQAAMAVGYAVVNGNGWKCQNSCEVSFISGSGWVVYDSLGGWIQSIRVTDIPMGA